MKRARRRRRRTSGSALLNVMMVSSLLMVSGMAMLQMTSTSATRVRRMTLDAAALAVAEAGVADMISKMTEAYTNWQNSAYTGTLNHGTYQVVARTTTNNNVIVTSVGTVHGVSRTTAIELLGTDRDRRDRLFGLQGAILAGGDVRFRTAAYRITGNVHANGQITSSNGAQNGDFLDCTITAVGSIGNLSATRLSGVEPREIPTFNFDSYRQLAISGGLYYDTGQTFSGVNLSPANGIVYVNGNVTIKNNSSLVGTLVANGDITLENNFVQTPYAAGRPAMLCTGTITMNNRGRLEGVVYAAVNAIVANNCDVLNGGIITGGFVDINSSTAISFPASYPDWDPLQPAVPPDVIVGGWLR